MVERKFSEALSTQAHILADQLRAIPVPQASFSKDPNSQPIMFGGKQYTASITSQREISYPGSIFKIKIGLTLEGTEVAIRTYTFEHADPQDKKTIYVTSDVQVKGQAQGSGIGLGLVLTTDDIITRAIQANPHIFAGTTVHAEIEDGAQVLDTPTGRANFSRSGWTSNVVQQFMPSFQRVQDSNLGRPMFRKTYQSTTI